MSEMKQERRPVNKAAVVKIVIWSVVFCLLGSILLAGIAGGVENLNIFGLPGIHINLGGFTYEDADKYSVGEATIKDTVTDLEINWVAGSIKVIPSDTDEIRVTETYSGDDDDLRLRWRVKDGKLTVQFRKANALDIFGTPDFVSKDLTVAVPAAMLESMDEVEIHTVSGGVQFTGNADEFTLDAMEGDLTVTGDIGALEVDAVDGKLIFTGGVRTADVDCANADITMYLDAAAELSFDQVDGDVHLYLSEDIKGFSAELDAISGEISVEGFDVSSVSNKSTRWGDGSLRIEMDGVGAELEIKKLTND
jgi:hypothetical protein